MMTRIFYKIQKKLKIIKTLGKNLLKLDTGNVIFLLNHEDCIKSMETLSTDKNKFKELDSDPTLTRLNTLQSYLCKLKNHKITEAEFTAMSPKKCASS